jgi:hypothetical protein
VEHGADSVIRAAWWAEGFTVFAAFRYSHLTEKREGGHTGDGCAGCLNLHLEIYALSSFHIKIFPLKILDRMQDFFADTAVCSIPPWTKI